MLFDLPGVVADPAPLQEPGVADRCTVGRMRTEAEFRVLFERAGMRLASVRPTASPNTVFAGAPA